ncbi:MAG: hypothetical protein EXR69_00640 [Myxococcales bacterium]|nr:hypothetical protein [Myxococcales bacterium]
MISLLLVLLPGLAPADELVAGDALRIYFDSSGTWNDQDAGMGFQALHGPEWVDWAYAGYPWQMFAFEYDLLDESLAYYANSNDEFASCFVSGEADLSTSDAAIATYTYTGTGAEIVGTQAWLRAGKEVRVNFHVTAGPGAELEELGLYFEVDPDPDGVFETINDVLDTDGDGADDLAVSSAAATGYALAFGACDPVISELGHHAGWSTSYSARPTLGDDDEAVADSALGIRLAPRGSIAAGASSDFTFVVIEGDSVAEVAAAWAVTDLCAGCDADGDGHSGVFCGGDDCDDAAPDAYPGAEEIWYDGIDEDCGGGSDYDQDGDGHESPAAPDGLGDDCEDTDAGVYPGAEDVLYDGVDADCSGDSDYDADGDGYDTDDFGGDDCNDNDAAVNPEAAEVYYDDIDQDCDGNDDDADGDGFDSPLDCDDTNPEIYPGAVGVEGDGVDSDCDGSDDDVAPDPVDDTGDAVKVEGGCGCATPSSGGGWPAWLAFALAALGFRRSGGRAGAT